MAEPSSGAPAIRPVFFDPLHRIEESGTSGLAAPPEDGLHRHSPSTRLGQNRDVLGTWIENTDRSEILSCIDHRASCLDLAPSSRAPTD